MGWIIFLLVIIVVLILNRSQNNNSDDTYCYHRSYNERFAEDVKNLSSFHKYQKKEREIASIRKVLQEDDNFDKYLERHGWIKDNMRWRWITPNETYVEFITIMRKEPEFFKRIPYMIVEGDMHEEYLEKFFEAKPLEEDKHEKNKMASGKRCVS